MHFHLPKPIHGWREFLGEVGIIVVGVGIALGAEQVIENAHWNHVVEAESQALEQEVQANHSSLLVRVMMQPCIDRRLDELAEVFRRHDAGLPLGLIGPIGRPTIFTGSKTSLAMATADQSLSHMPLARKQAIFDAYGAYDTFVPTANEERASWRLLQSLDHAATLDESGWQEMRKTYDAAADNNVAMKANLKSDAAGQWLTPFNLFPKPDRTKLMQTLSALPYVQKLCRPALAPIKAAS